MSKNAQPFGSRRGIGASVVRGNQVKLQQNKRKWVSELQNLLNEAKAMPSSATIVVKYHKEFGEKVADPVGLNDSYRSLCTIVSNHQEACTNLENRLTTIEKELTGRSSNLNDNLKMLDFANDIQNVMNDFGVIGMYAIDQCLEPFRDLARKDETVPMPGYMNPREGEPAIVEQYEDLSKVDSNLTVVDVPDQDQLKAMRAAENMTLVAPKEESPNE